MKIISLRKSNNQSALQTIIEGCRRGETRCQELLFKEFAPRILTTCRRYESSKQEAKDILQETFITVFKKIHQFNPQKGSMEGWIKRIAINTALKELRQQKLTFVDFSNIHEPSEELAEEITTVSNERILQAIKELPDGYRTVFNLFVLDGFSHHEVAAKLGISQQTSKSQLSKAKKMLRTKLTLKNNDYTIRAHGK